jgi:hypothetical protein
MPELSLTTDQLIALAPVLAEIENLSPPPTAKGRYALAKASAKAGPAFKLYAEQEQKLVARVAVKDKDGNPVLKDLGNGQAHFEVLPEFKDEYAKEMADLKAEPVVLEGVRAVTHAELGVCPITVAQEKVLIASGLLEDKEPA